MQLQVAAAMQPVRSWSLADWMVEYPPQGELYALGQNAADLSAG